MAGILYVVATPIGNLEDVTLRALRVLREVSLIAAEDTRRTARLLQHYSISTRTTSLHEHNEHEKAQTLVDRLKAGESIALVSDAGTPLVSDPGRDLVTLARSEGIRVEPIPGPSAVMAAISASGLATGGFCFRGFPPVRSKDRIMFFRGLRELGHTTIIFESPHRLQQTLAELSSELGGDHVIGVGRELTKAHEELVVRPINELQSYFADPRGEFTLIVPAKRQESVAEPLPDANALRKQLGEMTDSKGSSRRDALKVLASRYGVSVNALYRLLQEDQE